MAAVLRYALADVAPVVSLYVNDYNTPPARPTTASASARRAPS